MIYLQDREEAVQSRLRELIRLCELERGLILPHPTVEYVVGTKYAGKAYYTQNRILLNRNFLETYYEDMLKNTVPHELAHIVAYRLFPHSKPHGFTWASIMQDWFRVPPLRCHSYDTRIQKVDLSEFIS